MLVLFRGIVSMLIINKCQAKHSPAHASGYREDRRHRGIVFQRRRGDAVGAPPPVLAGFVRVLLTEMNRPRRVRVIPYASRSSHGDVVCLSLMARWLGRYKLGRC
ncbi:hypothetical protein L209DRAFT_368088 [Thermothelomyces heterothallicus CBS 203.75]